MHLCICIMNMHNTMLIIMGSEKFRKQRAKQKKNRERTEKEQREEQGKNRE